MVGSTGLVVSRQVRRVGVRPFLLAGPLGVAGGLGWLAFDLSPHASYLALLGPLVLAGLGMGLSFVPLTLNAVSSVARDQSGLASALLNSSQQVGGSLGLAALVTVAATVARDQQRGAPARASQVAHQAALVALTHGDRAAFLVAAAGAALAFVLAVGVLRPAKQDPLDRSGVEPMAVHLG